MAGRTSVVERKIGLDGTLSDFVCQRLRLEPGKRAVLRYVVDRERPVGGGELVLPAGTVTIAHYWSDRPYNVYHWVRPAGGTIAYYANVVDRTSIEESLVSYEDLAVDVLITPSGLATVLDEEELPPDLSPSRRAVVARALEALTSGPLRLAREVEAESRPYLAA